MVNTLQRRSQAEMQRRFVDLQCNRSELKKQLKTINEVLFSLGREIGQQFSFEEIYKLSGSFNESNKYIGFPILP